MKGLGTYAKTGDAGNPTYQATSQLASLTIGAAAGGPAGKFVLPLFVSAGAEAANGLMDGKTGAQTTIQSLLKTSLGPMTG